MLLPLWIAATVDWPAPCTVWWQSEWECLLCACSTVRRRSPGRGHCTELTLWGGRKGIRVVESGSRGGGGERGRKVGDERRSIRREGRWQERRRKRGRWEMKEVWNFLE